MRLLEEYSVGQTLGEGAFGVVSVCKKRATGEEFAVKMVDKVETPVDAIKREAEMLMSMNHPNIVKFHGVFYERCFVCIVMDKYSGGDLVEGLQRHLKEKGQINCHSVVHVAQQMGDSVRYLHGRNVVHRDIKGDNYLMDRKDMTDPKCVVVLTDFGTACHASPVERLSAGVGTKIFWSPEFFDRDYGQKVDVWAMGVIMYGLVSGRFPFRDEADIRTKDVRIPKAVHPVCQDLIRKMLEKSEKARLTAEEVMDHAWIAKKDSDLHTSEKGSEHKPTPAKAGEEEAPPTDANGLREDLVNDGIKERRQELINRLNKEHEVNRNPKGLKKERSTQHNAKKFSLPDKQVQGGRVVYEWWDSTKVKASGVLDVEGLAQAACPEEASTGADLAIFSSMLQDHNIDTKLFGVGKAKTLDQLAAEVRSGAARLMLDATEHKKLVRVSDIVVLRLRCADGSRLLIETEERYPDGRKRETNRLPGTKKEPHENTKQTAERILAEMLSMSTMMVQFKFDTMERYEEETESPSYPGVRTVYRKEMVDGIVSSPDASVMAKVGLPGFATWSAQDHQGNTKTFNWMTEKQMEGKKIKLRAEGAEAVSTLVRAPIGMNEETLRKFLTSLGVDISKYGHDGAKTLKEFSSELIKGESSLIQDASGSALRVVDVVVLIIQNPTSGDTLVQTQQVAPDGHTTVLNRLPGAKRRPDENQFLSARRIVRRQLEMDENWVQLQLDVSIVQEEKPSPHYPGLKTVYRKRLIKALFFADS